jgi:hypothetical protein
MLYIVFVKSNGSADQLEGAVQSWTAPARAQPGDIALFYFATPTSAIQAIGRTATPAESGTPDDWTPSDHGYFSKYENIVRLHNPLSLMAIRTRFPEWGRWKNLRGIRVHIVPANLCGPLAEMLESRNPSVRTLLSQWLTQDSTSTTPDAESLEREMATVRRRLRDTAFGRRVRRESSGECAACAVSENYEELGILEAAHIRAVAHNGNDALSNALALCPNHHALFDEGIWTVDGKRIILRKTVPKVVRLSFSRHIRCKWKLDSKELEWHRCNVFKMD